MRCSWIAGSVYKVGIGQGWEISLDVVAYQSIIVIVGRQWTRVRVDGTLSRLADHAWSHCFSRSFVWEVLAGLFSFNRTLLVIDSGSDCLTAIKWGHPCDLSVGLMLACCSGRCQPCARLRPLLGVFTGCCRPTFNRNLSKFSFYSPDFFMDKWCVDYCCFRDWVSDILLCTYNWSMKIIGFCTQSYLVRCFNESKCCKVCAIWRPLYEWLCGRNINHCAYIAI